MIEIVDKIKKDAYSYDVGVLKKYGESCYKVTWLKTLRNKGIKLTYDRRAKGTVHLNKLDCNIRRAKAKVKEYVLCNDWDYFITLTLDPKKYDRYNLNKFRNDLTMWIRNISRNRDKKIKYVLIPEQHRDGAWHMHGFVSGLNDDDVKLFSIDDRIPKYIKDKLKEGQEVYNWTKYMDKFGFCDLEPIRNLEKAVNYVMKYITKELDNCVKEVGGHLYYCSRGLNQAEIIKKGNVSDKYVPHYTDPEGHYSTLWLSNVNEKEAREFIQGDNITKEEILQEFEYYRKGFRKIENDNIVPF